jgi:hypothetical protein
MPGLDRGEPPANGVEQQGDGYPDQIDGTQVEPPPGRKGVEKSQKGSDVPAHDKGENDYQPVYDIEVGEVEEERHPPKGDKKA